MSSISRARNLAGRLRILKDEHTDVLEKRSAYIHDVNRAIVALQSYNNEKSRTEKSRDPVQQESGEETGGSQNTNSESERSQEENDRINEEIEEVSTARPEAPPWAKKAYRQIVQLTHPDKVNNNPEISDAQRDRMHQLYLEATDAFKSGRWEEILEVAAELDIEVDADPKMMEGALESKIKELTDSMEKLKGTIAWVWGTSFGDMEKRVNILVRCCSIMNISSPPVPALEEIVRELESNLEFDIVDRLGHVRRLKIDSTKRKIGSRPQKRIR